MAIRKDEPAAIAELKERYKVISKPLPQILDEIEDNIRVAVEVASRAEEAAKAARLAAVAATKASQEAEKRAEEARLVGEKAAEIATRAAREAAKRAEKASAAAKEAVKAEMLQRIESLEERLKNLEDAIPEGKIVVLREISREEAEKEILELFLQGQTLYYSDIAEKLGLDLKLVVEICNELQSGGEIEAVDDTLQRR